MIQNFVEQVVEIINSSGSHIADVHSDGGEYLLWIAKPGDEGDGMTTLMADFGVTWEPTRAWNTPCWGHIDGDDPGRAARQLIALEKELTQIKEQIEAGVDRDEVEVWSATFKNEGRFEEFLDDIE